MRKPWWWATHQCLHEQPLRAATTRVVNQQHRQWLAAHWGGGGLSSSDGQRFPVSGAVRNASDRGGQYCGKVYRALLHRHEALRSQSRRGECLDNAQAESLWSRLKTEELEQREWPVFRDLGDAQQSVATYFDYYNHERRHSALAYQTPQTFYIQQLKNTAQLCLA